MALDARTLAGVDFLALVLNFFGALYLAYDLLGGERGPLRTITRGVTYAVVFGLGYGVPLGAKFGAVAGVGFGTILAVEFRRRADGRSPAPAPFATLRGVTLGVGVWVTFGAALGVAFGILSAAALLATYALLHASPSDSYFAASRPRLFDRSKLVSSAVRGLAVALAGVLAGAISGHSLRAMELGALVGIVAGVVGVAVGMVSPVVEWHADRLPPRALGAAGALLVVIGFALQAIHALADLLAPRNP